MNIKINYTRQIISLRLIILRIIFIIGNLILIYNNETLIIEWNIINSNSNFIYISILLDWISLTFLSFVLGISSAVIFYRIEYIEKDLNLNRFIYLVLIFVVSIIFLIIRPNLVRILIGWDGLGLVSYCLVIYYQNYKSYNAGILTALTNRIGDVALLISIAWIINFGSWNYLFYLAKINNFNLLTFIVILAAFTKRAQIPFSSWLPAAIAAPTPVSSLVHSSTLVTAGIYLIIRFNLLIINFSITKLFLLLSILTIIMSGVGANFEFDLKKIIALSTLSQLGFIIAILIIGFPTLAFLHLLTHALFKALLFLCAGVIIHCIWGNQDIRFIGRLINQLPIITSCINISNLALCGFPFLAGFYSKDLIIESIIIRYFNLLIFILFIIRIGLTSIYSIRLTYYSLLSRFNSFSYISIFDCSKNIKISIVIIVSFSIFGGSIMNWLIFESPTLIFLPFKIKIITITTVILGAWIGYEINNFNKKIIKINIIILFFLRNIWFIPILSTFYINNTTIKFSLNWFKLIDQGWGEFIGPIGISKLIIKTRKVIQTSQNNNFKIYIIIFIIWLRLMVFFS